MRVATTRPHGREATGTGRPSGGTSGGSRPSGRCRRWRGERQRPPLRGAAAAGAWQARTPPHVPIPAEIVLEPAEAFGGYLPELVFATPASKLPEEILPEIGVKARLEIPGESDVEVTHGPHHKQTTFAKHANS